MSSSQRSVIPIPSFATSSSSSSSSSQKSKEDVDRIRLPFGKKQVLLQLDCALQMHFNQTKTTEISYPEFCRLVPKLVLEQVSSRNSDASKVAAKMNNNNVPKEIQTLSREQRLWHDLHCIFVPTLYHSNNDKQSGGESPISTLKQTDTEHRWKQAREILDSATKTGTPKEISDTVLRFFFQYDSKNNKQPHRTKKHEKKQDSTIPQNKENTSSNSIIKAGMTLEERVRARANQREQELKKRNRSDNVKKEKAIDIVKVADLLFSHARHVLRKNNNRLKLQQKSSKKTTTVAVPTTTTVYAFTFQELLQTLPLSYRQQASNILQDIHERCPDWLKWKNPKSSFKRKKNKKKKNDGIVIAKNATVWIETCNYKQVREALLGGGGPTKTSIIKTQQQQRTTTTTPKDRNTIHQSATVTLSRTKRAAAEDNSQISFSKRSRATGP